MHLIRHSLTFVSYKDRRAVAAALKEIFLRRNHRVRQGRRRHPWPGIEWNDLAPGPSPGLGDSGIFPVPGSDGFAVKRLTKLNFGKRCVYSDAKVCPWARPSCRLTCWRSLIALQAVVVAGLERGQPLHQFTTKSRLGNPPFRQRLRVQVQANANVPTLFAGCPSSWE